MSGCNVFLATRSAGMVRLFEVWTYEDAEQFPWTFLARNLPTVADIGLRKLVKLLSRIPGGKEASGVGREALEEWFSAPKIFGQRPGAEPDLLKVVSDLGAGYPIGLLLDADENSADVFRPDVHALPSYGPPLLAATCLQGEGDEGYENVLRIRPRDLRTLTQALVDAMEGRLTSAPDHTFWEQALLHAGDRTLLDQAFDQGPGEGAALEEARSQSDLTALAEAAIAEDDWASLQALTEAGHAEIVRLLLQRHAASAPKPRRRFFPAGADPSRAEFMLAMTGSNVESSDPGQASPA